MTHPRYGWRGSDPFLHEREAGAAGRITEFPPTTRPFFGRRLPAAGGAYLRLFPLGLVRGGFRHANRSGQPGILYLHPWEFDPDQPRVPVGRITRWRHYGNIDRTADRMCRLIDEFEFTTVRDVLADRAEQQALHLERVVSRRG